MKWILKIIHNEHIALLWALAVEIVVHGFFGLQAFLLGGFLGEVALVRIFGPDLGVQIGAWSLGILIFGMAFVSFVLGEYLKEHVQAFVYDGKGDSSFLKAFTETARMAVGLELASLAFRVITVGFRDGDWPSAIVIAIAGCIGLRYAISMAKVIHASVNRPVEHDLMRSQQQAGLTLAEKAMHFLDAMSPEQLARWADGDASALQEVAGEGFAKEDQAKDEREQRAIRKREKAQAKEQAKVDRELERQQQHVQGQQKQEKAKGTAGDLLNPRRWVKPSQPKGNEDFIEAQMNSQANRLSQKSSNGHHSN